MRASGARSKWRSTWAAPWGVGATERDETRSEVGQLGPRDYRLTSPVSEPLTYAMRWMESDAGRGKPALRPLARSCSSTESERQAARAVLMAADAGPARSARLPAPEPPRS